MQGSESQHEDVGWRRLGHSDSSAQDVPQLVVPPLLPQV